MSRSALWRQEGNVKERERQAEELFRLAVEEGRNNRAKNLVPMWGPDDSFHLNPMLLQNIIKSPYFQKCCRDITDWNTLVDQIYYDVKHVEPWAQGSTREPSAAFCLLLRLLTLRCTEKQMTLLLTHADSPYIRAIGFLYLRYAGDPVSVYKWIEPYLYDDEPIEPRAKSAKQSGASETIGEYVRRLFTDKNYYGTILPRLPIQIEREIQVKLLQAEKIEERAKKHAADSRTMGYFQRLGSKVMALYGDEENPIQWYEAVVDRVITTHPETLQKLKYPKFVVTFPEYGNTETVTLGEIEMLGMPLDKPQVHRGDRDDRSHETLASRDQRSGRAEQGDSGHGDHPGDFGNRGGYSSGRGQGYRGDWERDRPRGYRQQDSLPRHGSPAAATLTNEADLYEEVRRRERETVTSSSRNAIARRPPTTKASLSVASHRGPSNQTYSSEAPPAPYSRNEQKPSPSRDMSSDAPSARKRTAEELAMIEAKKRKLLAKYG